MADLIYNQWLDCTEDYYWQTDNDIFYVPEPIDMFGSRRECPYGWNVLVRNNAKIMHIKLPEVKES